MWLRGIRSSSSLAGSWISALISCTACRVDSVPPLQTKRMSIRNQSRVNQSITSVLKTVSFLPDCDHSFSILVLLFVHVNVCACNVLDGRNVAATSTHNPRHHRGRDRKLLGSKGEMTNNSITQC